MFVTSNLTYGASPPRVLVDDLALVKVANEPEITTPIGITWWENSLFVVESHTHQRPADYPGPTTDRIRRLSDSNGDGKLDQWSTWAEGFQQAMNVLPAPQGGLFVVTRRDLQRLSTNRGVQRGQDGGEPAATRETLLRLKTTADYPHNGLSGIVLDAHGRMFVGLGENYGAPYRLEGSDGSYVDGRGGWGAVFSCTPQGTQVQRWATGFWNPFSLCVASDHLFTVDNDPDASPPCRLLDVVRSGDYGHRFEYGRAGIHPLQAWDGELPGTLPMVCGTGEAPTAVLAHRGYLWVTSWGDHRIERYRLQPRAGSYLAEREVVVQGDHEFRPTGMTIAPDGSIYFADWVNRSYPVHGAGKVWQITFRNSPSDDTVEVVQPESPSAQEMLEYQRSSPEEPTLAMLTHADPFVRQRSVAAWSECISSRKPPQEWFSEATVRVAWLQAQRWASVDGVEAILSAALRDPDRDVRMFAVRWIADERITALRENVASLLDADPLDGRYFLAVIAALDWLDGKEETRNSQIEDALLRRELANPQRSAMRHALALRMISPDHEWLTQERLRQYLQSPEEALRREAIRTVAFQPSPARFAILAEVAKDASNYSPFVRGTAVAGMAAAPADLREMVTALTSDPDATVRRMADAVRRIAMPQASPSKSDPATAPLPPATDLAAWDVLLQQSPGDPVVGELLFFMPGGTQCVRCHQHQGRGGTIGPDLTRLGQRQNRTKIVESILQPSREIAPQYQAWILQTHDGRSLTGLRLARGGDKGEEAYVDTQGERFLVASEQIEVRQPSEKSIMPEGLEQTLSVADLRDLLAFLTSSAKKD